MASKQDNPQARNTPAPEFEAKTLVSPRTTFGFSVDTWVTQMAGDGTPVRKQVSFPLRLVGGITVGQTADDPSKTVERVRDAEVVGFKDGLRLEGCSLRVDQELAKQVGFEDTEDTTAFEKLVTYIKGRATYGARMAFADDDEALDKLLPQFAKNIANRQEDDQNARDYIALLSQGFN